MRAVDETHDPALRSWLDSASDPATGFPIQNLPFGRLRTAAGAPWRLGVAIGDRLLDLQHANLASGDRFGSGTMSGPLPEQGGSLMELSQGGRRALQLSNGETRSSVQDGAAAVPRGYCERAGLRRIGFGACAATVLPALPPA